MRVRVLLFFILAGLYVSAANAEDADYYMRLSERAMSPFRTSPRATGMGGAYTALGQGAHGVYENPAALAGAGQGETFSFLGYSTKEEGTESSHYTSITVGGAAQLSAFLPDQFPERRDLRQAVGVSYTRAWGTAGGVNGWDQSSNRVNLGYGRTYNYGRVMAGIGLGLHTTSIDESSLYEIDRDEYEIRMGTSMRITETFTIGGVFAYGGGDSDNGMATGDTSSDKQGDSIFMELRGGGALRLSETMIVSADIAYHRLERDEREPAPREKERHGIFRISTGTEMVLSPESITARAGLFWEHDDWESENLPINAGPTHGESYVGATGGISFFRDNWSAGYDLEVRDTGDHKHNLSLLFTF